MSTQCIGSCTSRPIEACGGLITYSVYQRVQVRAFFSFHRGSRIKSSARETFASLPLAGTSPVDSRAPFDGKHALHGNHSQRRWLEMVGGTGLAEGMHQVVCVLCGHAFYHALFGRVCMIQCKAKFPRRLRHAFPSGTRQIWMPCGTCSMMSCVLRRVQTQCVWPRPRRVGGCGTRPADACSGWTSFGCRTCSSERAE